MISRFYLFIYCHQNNTLWPIRYLGDIGEVDDLFVSNVFDSGDSDM